MLVLRRAHEDADRRNSLVVRRGMLVKRVCVVNSQQRRDGGRPDVQNPGVGHFTVDLHHHLKLPVSNDALIYIHCRQNYRHLGSLSFVVARGWKQKVILSERHDVESVWTAIEFIKEVAVGVRRSVVHLQLTARILSLCSFSVLDSHNLRRLFLIRLQNGPSGFVIAVTHASGFGLLHFVTVDPAPELVRQLHALGSVDRRLAGGRGSQKDGILHHHQRFVLKTVCHLRGACALRLYNNFTFCL